MVENELVTGSLASRTAALARYQGEFTPIPPTPSEYQRDSANLDDENSVSNQARFERTKSGHVRNERRGKVGSEGGRLYADFMRSGGRDGAVVTGKGSMEGHEQSDYINGGMDGMVDGEGRVEEIRSP